MSNDDRLSVLIVWYFVLYESLDPVGTISDSTIQNDAVVFVTILHAPVCDPKHAFGQFNCLYDIMSLHLISFSVTLVDSSSPISGQQ
jgi:hypothetical protein